MKLRFPLHALALAGLTMLAHVGNAHAQYAWTDERGARHYSDRPPPASVPESRVFKRPGGAPAPAPEALRNREVSAPAPAVSLAERNAEFRRRQAGRMEAENKAAEEARIAAEHKLNCERAAVYQRTLDSGVRIRITEGDGERRYLSDEQRARELRETRKVLSGCS